MCCSSANFNINRTNVIARNFQLGCVRVFCEQLQSNAVEASVQFIGDQVFGPLLVVVRGEQLEQIRRDAGKDRAMAMDLDVADLLH